MIAATLSTGQPQELRAGSSWQRALAEAITDPLELCRMLDLKPEDLDLRSEQSFPLRVPRSYITRMRSGDPQDPLLLQVLPRAAELHRVPGFVADPVGDLASRSGQALLQKYSGRALLITTGACPVHCRYCFRRHFPYQDESALRHGWQTVLAPVRADPSIHELILSGGDPLSLNERRLQELLTAVSAISHLRRIRIHTRFPVVLPERVDGGLLHWLEAIQLQKIIVIHTNHAREIDTQVARALADLAGTGAVLLNQSVLLAGINDSVAALKDLSEALFVAGVLPYYLHLLDRVSGAAHFEVEEERALELMQGLLAQLPGYLVPRLVREIAGAASKTPVFSDAREASLL